MQACFFLKHAMLRLAAVRQQHAMSEPCPGDLRTAQCGTVFLTTDNVSLCRIWKNKGDVWRLLQDVAVIIDGRTWNARDEPEVQLLLHMMTAALRLGCNPSGCAVFLSLMAALSSCRCGCLLVCCAR